MSPRDINFFLNIQKMLEESIEKRYQSAPSKEQIEYHIEAAVAFAKALRQVATVFTYEASWLEENLSRHPDAFTEQLKNEAKRILREGGDIGETLKPLD